MNPAFWKDLKVLVTGHTGFKGTWLTIWLRQLGASVVGYALPPPTEPSLFELTKIGKDITSIEGDVRDLDHLRTTVKKAEPEVIFHLAAQPLVRESYADPVTTLSTNVMGTVHILEAARSCRNTRAVLNVTSDKCYQNREWLWGYREDEAMGGDEPYSASKGCSELVTAAYRRSFFDPSNDSSRLVGIATARAGNVIGGGDWSPDRLVPDIIGAFADDRPAIIRNPGAVRPWQHVLEPLAGYITLAERLVQKPETYSSAWNFGPDDSDAQPVSTITDQLAAFWSPSASWTTDSDLSHPRESHYLKIDSSKSHFHLGWRPQLGVPSAIEWTVAWYKAFFDDGNMRDITGSQISRYQNNRDHT